MTTRHQDMAFSIGSSCNCSKVLREAGLQYGSFPMDWLGRVVEDQPISEAFRQHVDLAISDFKGMLLLENLGYLSQEGDHIHSHVEDKGTGISFFHDFPCRQTLEEAYPAVIEKYRRRTARFRALLEKSRSALVVWMGDARDNGRVTEEDIAYCLRRFSEEYPKTRFQMLLLESPEGFPMGEHRIEQGEDFERHLLNYRYGGASDVVWRIAEDRILPILSKYSVRDYRSHREKTAYRRSLLNREFAAFHARNRLELIWCKFQYRLFRHLQKRLGRRGVHIGAHA